MDNVTTFYLTQGVLGVTVIVLGFVIVWQQKRVDKKDIQISALQESRLADATKYMTSFVEISKETVQTSKDHLAALTLLQRSADALAAGLQKVIDNK